VKQPEPDTHKQKMDALEEGISRMAIGGDIGGDPFNDVNQKQE